MLLGVFSVFKWSVVVLVASDSLGQTNLGVDMKWWAASTERRCKLGRDKRCSNDVEELVFGREVGEWVNAPMRVLICAFIDRDVQACVW